MQTERTRREQFASDRADADGPYRLLAETAPDAVFVFDEEGTILFANAAAEKIFGYAAEEMRGRGLTLLLPDFVPAHLPDASSRPGPGSRTGVELAGRRREGGELPLEISFGEFTRQGRRHFTAIVRDASGRRRADDELRLLESAVRQASEAVLVTGAELDEPGPEIVFVNPAFTRMTGYAAEEAVGRSPRFLQGPGTDRALLDELRAQLARGESFEGEAVNYRKDGAAYHVAWRIAPVRDESGRVTHFVSVQSDVTGRRHAEEELKLAHAELESRVAQRTSELVAANSLLKDEIAERKLAEEALRVSEQTFRELVDVLPVAAYVCDQSGTIESYNRRAVELWGRAPKLRDLADCFCGSYRIYTPDGTFLPHAECPMAQVLRTSVPVSNEEIVIGRPDGSRRTAVVNIIPRRDGQGNMTGAINCLTDITERKEAEQALKESEERYRLVVEHSPDPVAIHADGVILYVNPAAVELFGAAGPEELVGRPILDTLHPDHHQHFKARTRKLREAARLELVEEKLVRLDGQPVEVEAASIPFNYQGRRAILSVARDITGRKRAEEERARLLRRLVSAQEEERRRIARELHDQLGPYPTALLLGLKRLKESGQNPAAVEEGVGELMRLADHLGQELHRLAWELRPAALDDLGLHTALANYVEEWSARFRIAADFHSNGLLERRLPPQVEIALYRIVQEALTNVSKHAGARRVSVITEYRQGRLLAVVEDDGRGFNLAEVFGAAAARRRLGLIGMRERARMLGGEVEIESAPGSGTTLYVRVPVAPEG